VNSKNKILLYIHSLSIMKSDCSSCKNELLGIHSSSSFLGILLVAIIPKCPICIMAYSGAITMCSGEQLLMHSNNWVSYLPILIAIALNGLIIFNPKGAKTFWAFPFSLSGLLLVILSHQMILPSYTYDIGSILLFIGVGINSNWRSVVHQLKDYLNSLSFSSWIIRKNKIFNGITLNKDFSKDHGGVLSDCTLNHPCVQSGNIENSNDGMELPSCHQVGKLG
jgi:hypothetical protein